MSANNINKCQLEFRADKKVSSQNKSKDVRLNNNPQSNDDILKKRLTILIAKSTKY